MEPYLAGLIIGGIIASVVATTIYQHHRHGWQGAIDECVERLLENNEDRGIYAGLELLLKDSAAWADATFGRSTPEAILTHIQKEVDEALAEAQGSSRQYEECVDIQLLVGHLLSWWDIPVVYRGRAKLNINKERKWGPPDPVTGVVEHVR